MSTVLVAVGTTRFDDLVNLIFTDQVLEMLARHGHRSLILQHGASPLPQHAEQMCKRHGINLDAFKFTPELGKHINRADLVISHAGSGMILDTLRGPLTEPQTNHRPHLLVVTNDRLMHGHQQELANALSKSGQLLMANITYHAKIHAMVISIFSNFVNQLERIVSAEMSESSPPLPQPQTGRFFQSLDQLMIERQSSIK